MRQEEFYFLGMQRRPQTAKERETNNPIRDMKFTKEHRKQIQENHLVCFDQAREELKREIEDE